MLELIKVTDQKSNLVELDCWLFNKIVVKLYPKIRIYFDVKQFGVDHYWSRGYKVAFKTIL